MKRIAVMIGGLVIDSQRQILEGIYKAAEQDDIRVYTFSCHVLMYHKDQVISGAHTIYSLPDLSFFDGLIFTPNSIWDKASLGVLLEHVARSGIPAVCAHGDQPGIASVVGGDYKGIYDLVEHLINDHGARTFWYVSGPEDNPGAQERKSAFLDALKNHHITIDTECIAEGAYSQETGRDALRGWQEHFDKLPDAIVCAADMMALGILVDLTRQGYHVPEDVIVTGFDNSREARCSFPVLTTVDSREFEMGSKAVALLKEAWGGKDIKKSRIKLTAKVVHGGSCGCHPDHKTIPADYVRYNMIQDSYDRDLAMMVKSMSAELSTARDYEELVELLKGYVYHLQSPYCYICLCDPKQIFAEEPLGEEEDGSDLRLMGGYTDMITVPIAYENGVFNTYEPFPRGQVLPAALRDRRDAVNYVFLPLHHQNETFGYCVFGNSVFPTEYTICYTWLQIISSAIQNVRCRNRLQGLVQKLNDMWIYDPLTHVYNRAGFFQKAKELQKKAAREHTGIYVLFLDMDGLKQVNDTYGHEMGDRYIMKVADILKDVTEEDELVMRYGGDEFAVVGIYRDYIREKELMNLIEEKVALVNAEGHDYHVSVSMGAEGFNDGGETNIEKILEDADQKMYEQKRDKKRFRSRQ
jgi:diguanylate cyclase (GGDEF)-like protein